jgi:hypothetical protein
MSLNLATVCFDESLGNGEAQSCFPTLTGTANHDTAYPTRNSMTH